MNNSMLAGKRVLLGVTGSIAAYRSAELVRRLTEGGTAVEVVMTPNAAQFISSLTLQAVSGNPVRTELFDEQAEAGMGHIELARSADVILVAPASAGFIARLAHGFADDLLSTLCLATESPIVVAPAMNRVMWADQATQHNVSVIERRGVRIIGPSVGDQACGETGPGRMLLPEEIVDKVAAFLSSGLLQGINTVITAGSTWEAIDPVRGLTNLSSGKMGYAIADAAVRAGANVCLISGQTSIHAPPAVETLIRVTSALDMQKAVMENMSGCELFISVAAVADYRPSKVAQSKIKKTQDETMQIELVRNPDILAEVKKRFSQVYAVGFAAESKNLVSEGKRKLLSKGVDLIAANAVGGPNSALGSDSNAIELIDRNGVTKLGPDLKSKIAENLIEQISIRIHAQSALQDSR